MKANVVLNHNQYQRCWWNASTRTSRSMLYCCTYWLSVQCRALYSSLMQALFTHQLGVNIIKSLQQKFLVKKYFNRSKGICFCKQLAEVKEILTRSVILCDFRIIVAALYKWRITWTHKHKSDVRVQYVSMQSSVIRRTCIAAQWRTVEHVYRRVP